MYGKYNEQMNEDQQSNSIQCNNSHSWGSKKLLIQRTITIKYSFISIVHFYCKTINKKISILYGLTSNCTRGSKVTKTIVPREIQKKIFPSSRRKTESLKTNREFNKQIYGLKVKQILE